MRNKLYSYIFWSVVIIFLLAVSGCDSRSTGPDELDDMTGELILEALSDSEIQLSWNSNSDVKDDYLIERAENAGNYAVIAEVSPSQTVYVDTALTTGDAYRYRLSGRTGEKQTNYLEGSIDLTFKEISSFNASAVGIHTVELSWEHDCSYETGYRLERRIGEGSDYSELVVLEADVFSYIDSLAIPGNPITYRISSFSAYNESTGKEAVTNLTFPGVDALSVSQLDVNRFRLSWIDQAEGEDFYEIERRIDSGTNIIIAQLPADTEEYIDDISNRTPISRITWWIRGKYQDYESNFKMIDLKVGFPSPYIEQIEEINLSTCRITWEDNSIGETGFYIDRSLDQQNWDEMIGSVGANETEWEDENVELLEWYFYRVRAISVNNESAPSNVYPWQQIFPNPDGLVYEVTGFGTIHLTWNDNSIGEEGFRLDRHLQVGSWDVGYQEFSADTEEFTDTGVESGSIVSYRIYAFWGEYVSNSDNLYDIEVIVEEPDDMFYQVENIHTVNLYWSDNIDGEEGYRIDRETNGIWENGIEETQENAESWTDMNMPLNSEIRYRIYAFQGELEGEKGSTEIINTEVAAPGALAWNLEELSAVELNWLDEIEGENGYAIDRYTESNGWVELYDSVPENTETWRDEDIVYGDILRYRVYAYYGEDAGSAAETEDIYVLLPAPEDLNGERTGLDEVSLNWNDMVNGEDSYVIDRRLQGEDWITEYAVLPANIESYTDNGLELGSEVQYRVYGRIGANNGAVSETDWILLDFPVPENFNVVFTEPDELHFTWNYSIDDIDGFYIESYEYDQGWENFVSNISPEDESCNTTGGEWGIYRITAYIGTEYLAVSKGAGVAAEGFTAVAGGVFEMGDHFLEGDEDELPVHEVEVSGFYISTTEVTQEDFLEQMGYNPSLNTGTGLPVENLEWLEAVEYCNALSIAHGFTSCYTISGEAVSCDWYADGYRLLTEAEWEYAARGGTHWEDNFRYSGTTADIRDYVWSNSNSGNQVQGVGIKLPNQLGIYDMSGNIWEMCWDYYDEDYYSVSSYTDPLGPGEGFSRIIRGGGYNSSDENCRVANRYHRDESYNDGNLGFRICRRR